VSEKPAWCVTATPPELQKRLDDVFMAWTEAGRHDHPAVLALRKEDRYGGLFFSLEQAAAEAQRCADAGYFASVNYRWAAFQPRLRAVRK